MNLFDYIRPASVAEAVTAASEPGAAYLAGGTNLLDLMKGGALHPGRLVYVTRLPGLDRIEKLADGATVGHDMDENQLRGLWRHYAHLMSHA